MTRHASPRLTGYTVLTALGVFGALALRRPELAVLAAPFAAMLALGLSLDREPALSARLQVHRGRALEGDEVPAELEVHSESAVERLEVLLVLPTGLESGEGENPTAVKLRAGESRVLPLSLRCDRWGVYALGDVRLRARLALGLSTWEQQFESRHELRVYPGSEQLRGVIAPLETKAHTGNQVARAKGDGLEFADLRPYVPGDRLRSINWRASARRNDLVVNEFHPERATEVILFLDSFAEARTVEESTIDHAVRAAVTLAEHYLAQRHRVGLVTFGGVLRWLQPASGMSHRYRIVEALLETEVEFSHAWKDVDVIPPHALPPRALVLAVTPLLDPRAVSALLDLRARGFDVAAVEVSPVSFVEPGVAEHEQLAFRLWLLRRAELRSRFERIGIAVVEWSETEPLAAAIEGVREYRRHVALARR